VPSSGSPVPADAVGLCDGCPQRLVIIFDNLVVVIRVTVNLIRFISYPLAHKNKTRKHCVYYFGFGG
jgi:hypothetical protein